MTLVELKGALISHYTFAANLWRESGADSRAASFVIERAKPPTGYKIKVSPFGNCEILNCKHENGKYSTCFSVTQKQLENAISRLEKINESIEGQS